jgi:bacteriocin immunity protein
MEVFNMKYRLFLVIFLSSILDILLGTFLQISNVSIGWLVLYSALFEAGVFLLTNKGLTVQIKEADIQNRFKFIFGKTIWFQILLLIFVMAKLYLGLDAKLILFYGHIFIIFNALIYLLSSSRVSLKKSKPSS